MYMFIYISYKISIRTYKILSLSYRWYITDLLIVSCLFSALYALTAFALQTCHF